MTTPAAALIDALRPTSDGAVLASSTQPVQAAALRLAKMERVRPGLGALAIRQGWASEPSPAFAAYLRSQDQLPLWPDLAVSYALNKQRMLDLSTQLATITAAFDAAGLLWYPLKGAALLRAASWPDPAERSMTDLDLLLPDPAQLAEASSILHDLGYVPAGDDQFRHEQRHHLTAKVLPGHLGSVELHRDLLTRRHRELLPLTGVLARAEPGALAVEDLARHIVAHARIVDQQSIRGLLGIRAVLDLGYLLLQHPGLADRLAASGKSTHPALIRAIKTQLAAIDALFNGSAPSGWFALAARLSNKPGLQWWWERCAALPSFFGRERMEIRVGRELNGWDLPKAYLDVTVERLSQEWRQRR